MGTSLYKATRADRRVKLYVLAAGCATFFLVGCQVSRPLPNPLVIHFTGTNHQWQAEYQMPDGPNVMAGPDLHVPVGSPVVFMLRSTDYIYTMAIPAFELKEIAVPELEFHLSLRPQRQGTYPLVGEELCGLPGRAGPGRLIVESVAEFRTWLETRERAEHDAAL